MDPDVYRSYRTPLAPLPPFIPIPHDVELTSKAGWNLKKSVPALPHVEMMQDAARSSSDTNQDSKPWMSIRNQQPFMFPTGQSEESTPRPCDYATSYPAPDLSLPHPTLNLDFRMSVTLHPKISVGPTPFGHRNWISFTGGMWSGCWGSGIVLPGGQDSQLLQPDGTTHLETNYILQTYDSQPAYIVVKTKGWRTGSPEVLAMLADPKQASRVDPNSYRFRIFIEMETGDERYREKVNYGMWVGSGMRKGAEVIYDAYRVS